MTNPNDSEHGRVGGRIFSPYLMMVVGVSLVAIVATYILANSSLEVAYKTRGFAVIIAMFLVACVCLNWMQSRRLRKSDVGDAGENKSDADVERGLVALDEASSFFSGSLKSADAFRLISSRVHDLLPFKSIVLYLLDETRTQLVAVETEGIGSEVYKGKAIGFDDELAGQCYSNRHVEIDSYLGLDSTQDLGASVAIPLCRDTEVFGVLQLFFDADLDLAGVDRSLFEAVGTRVAPMMLSSIAFERSLSNALTDPTTDLPNERAFFLVLENQIAESQRKRDERSLTILAIDIKNFDNINGKYGHASGDRVLKFVARTVKVELRQMDFFARASNDEFLVILPTASKQVSWDIIARIQTAFFGNRLKLTETDAVQIDLNYGSATFWKDGETAGQLLNTARLRKQQSKSTEPNKVLWFPMEFVN